MGTSLLADTLRRHRHFEVSTAFDSHELSDKVDGQAGLVLILSTELDDQSVDGFLLLRRLRAARPDVRAIMLLDTPRRDQVIEAFRSGANGVFCRSDPIHALRKCIYRVYAGEIWANNQELEFVLEVLRDTAPLRLVEGNGQNLLDREREIIECIAGGLSNRQIGDRLKLSEHTVKNYLARIYQKLGVSTRAEVIFYACTCHNQEKRAERSLLAGLNGDAARSLCELAEQGFVLPQFLLARMYRDGKGAPQDPLLAYRWFLIAEQACRRLGLSSQRERRRLRSQLDAGQIRSAESAALEHLSKIIQQTDPELWQQELWEVSAAGVAPAQRRAPRKRKRLSRNHDPLAVEAQQPG